MRAFIRQKVNACITKVTITNLGKKSSSIGPFSLEIDVIKVTEQKQPNTHTHTNWENNEAIHPTKILCLYS